MAKASIHENINEYTLKGSFSSAENFSLAEIFFSPKDVYEWNQTGKNTTTVSERPTYLSA